MSKRLQNVIRTLTLNIYAYGCTGIFEKHKVLFSFQICTRIEQDVKHIDQMQLDFFIKGNVSLERSDIINPTDGWLSISSWEDVLKLSLDFPEKFENLPTDLANDVTEWKEV